MNYLSYSVVFIFSRINSCVRLFFLILEKIVLILNPAREIEGEGIVGEQPILSHGRKHVYVSGCDLHSEIGYMRGHYIFERIGSRETFEVEVPRFDLVTKPKLN